MRRKLIHIVACLLAALYAADGAVVHLLHQHGGLACGDSACQVSSHSHSHSHDADESHSAHHHAHSQDGHTHSHAKLQEKTSGQPQAPSHDHENCIACRYLANVWIPVEFTIVEPVEPLVAQVPPAIFADAPAAPVAAARSRGPPALALSA